jgi:formylglycine-generating enzyme required for sulfatase activity
MRTVLSLALLALACSHVAGREVQPARQPKPVAAKAVETLVDDITGSSVKFEMVSLPGGTYQRGSAPSEAGRKDDEGPAHQVTVGPFLIGRREVTWDEFDQFFMRERKRLAPGEKREGADAITGPTPPYADEAHDFGKGPQPVMSISQHAATEYARWLSAKTGRKYRLPTEAEWEYACRAGTTTAYSFGPDKKDLGAYGWFEANADGRPHPVGQKQPNAWGLYDMHGNIAEWTADLYKPDAYAMLKAPAKNPWVDPGKEPYPHVARGGSWDDDPEDLRCAARRASSLEWNRRDPQIPQSIWWLTDGTFVGFRVVREP